jgi:hypothetical protein
MLGTAVLLRQRAVDVHRHQLLESFIVTQRAVSVHI